MNSRERLRATLNRQPTDRIPIDFCGTAATGITATALYHLRQCLGQDVPVRLYDVYDSLAEIDDLVSEALCTDTLRLPVPVPLLNIQCRLDPSKKCWKTYALEDGTPVLIPNDFYPEREYNGDICLRDFQDRRFARMPRGDYRFAPVTVGPGALGMSTEAIRQEIASQNPAVGFPKDAAYWPLLKLAAQTFAKTSDKALVFPAGPFSPFFAGLGQGDTARWLARLAANDPEADAVLDLWLEYWLGELELLVKNTGNTIDVFLLTDDFTSISLPEDELVIQRKILPQYAQGIRFLRQQRPDARILWQSAGLVTPYLPTLIDMEVDAVGLVDLSPRRMNPLTLKKEFGQSIAFWGGAYSPKELADGSEETLLRHLREYVNVLAEGGGYIHALSGNILPETEPENVLTFFSLRG